MFTISKKNTFLWPITFKTPSDGGTYETHTFEAEFQRLPQSELEKLSNDIENGKTTDKKIAEKVLVGWKSIQNDDGSPVDFNATNKAAMLDVAGMATQLTMDYIKALGGVREKN